MSEYSEIEPIAIIGIALRVPGASTVEVFWDNMRDGVESVTRFTRDELCAAGIPDELLDQKSYVRACPTISDVEMFDAEFFGLKPSEAAMMDPQHRLFLECAWEALERAAHDPARFAGLIGIYGSCFMNKYLPLNLYTNDAFLRSPGAYFARNFNDKDFLAGRAAYFMNLRGPVVTVQTACSSSLVATHIASQALLTRECDMALVGAATINLPAKSGYLALDGTMLSTDGTCRPFDADACGTLFGNGAAFVVLRRLSDALADGDRVHAIIRGTAISNDGGHKISFTAPNADAQTAVIATAQAVAGVSPDTIGYVEAHGTGTLLGDPIEVAALTAAFRQGTSRRGFCGLGSAKANVGHLDAAAGVIGLIRAALAIERAIIPPQANYRAPNPQLHLESTPFFIPAAPVAWSSAPRRAGVSSFGVGGTNAHVVLEQAPARSRSNHALAAAPVEQLLVVSARSAASVEASCTQLAAMLERDPEVRLPDVARTLAEGRRRFAARRFAIGGDDDAAAAALRRPGPTAEFGHHGERQVVFMFPGVGTQYPDMALGLYDQESVFRAQVDACAEIIGDRLGMDLRRFLFPSRVAGPPLDPESVPHVLAAIFTIEYALARLWMSWGVMPAAMIGHSLGEYIAACLAEVLTLDDALDLTIRRGRIFDAIPDGRMMGVALPVDQLMPLLGESVWLGAINAPTLSLVSGRKDALAALERALSARGVTCRPLPIRMASHSGLLDPFLAPFTEVVASYRRSAPKLPYGSCVTGTWITASEATNPAYWARQLREPVQFARLAATLREQPSRILLEVGPGQTLTSLIGAQGVQPAQTAVPSMRRADMAISDRAAALTAAGRLWQHGIELDWERLRGGLPAHRVALPTYPFQRKRHWIDAGYPTGPGLTSRLPQAPATTGEPTEASPAPAPVARSREAVVARIWCDVLGMSEIGIDDDFASIGGHSLLAAQVAMQLRAELACEIASVDVYLAPTIRQLAALLDERARAPGVRPARASLASDVRLDPAIAVDPARPGARRPAHAVLLTGATGYLGAYLLAELLHATTAQVYCLVRAGDPAEAELRLRRKLAPLELANLPWHRVIAIPGDLERDELGVSPSDRARVAAECDAIYHCGAWVNFSRPYRVLQRANVHGTEQILRLATTGRRKDVHFISTIFVSMGAIAAGATTIAEDDPLPPPEGHDTGYTESKWVSEGICRLAIERGIALAIHRPGNILGDSRTGVCNLEDYVTRMILGCVQLGAAPLRNYPLPIGMVDEVARSIVAISQTPDCFGRTHHVIGRAPLHWNRIFEAVREAGHNVPSIPWADWCRRLTESARAGEHNALAPLVDLLNTASADRPMPVFATERAYRAGTACQVPAAVHLSRMLHYLTRSGRLPATPSSAAASAPRVWAGDPGPP